VSAVPDARPPASEAVQVSAGSLGVWIFGCFALAYSLSFALRSISAVIAPELMRDFRLSKAELGSLASAYFLAFALVQLPLGIALDRFGARRVHGMLLVVAAVGCAVFARSFGVTSLWVGRAMVGMGVAGALMAALKGFRFWFPPSRQQQLAAWMLVAGSLGALATTVPVRAVMPAIGWRGVFWAAAALFALSAALVLIGLPRDEERASGARADGALWSGYREVFASGFFWRFAIVSGLSHASFVSLQTLWAGPWMTEVLGQDADAAARTLLAFNAVLMCGYLGLSMLIPRLTARWSMSRIVVVGMVPLLGLEGAIALADGALAWLLWLALALVATFFSMVQPHVSLSFPAALTGRVYTGYNLLIFVSMFLSQWLFGVGVDAFERGGLTTPDAFRATLGALVALQALGVVVFAWWRPAPPASV
jgi:nitrate/nitrite transporter NarK